MQLLSCETHTFNFDGFDRLAKSEPGHFWFEERRALIAWALSRYFPEAKSFCDVGCGTGFVLAGIRKRHPSLRLTGLDAYPEGLAYAARLLEGVELHRSNILWQDFPAEFDVVGAFDILEHIPDDQTALDRLAARVRPGGGIILTVPQHPALWSVADEIGYHQRRYTRDLLLDRIAASGLTRVRVTSFNFVTLPIFWLRRRQNLTREKAFAELAPSRLSNGIGQILLRLERALIAKGFSFPCGSSLLAVARKPVAR